MNRPKYLSPFRYPGSKREFAQKYLLKVLQYHKLVPELYVEPFAGGASAALELLVSEQVDKIILMDIDPLIGSFWKTVFNKYGDREWLIDRIQDIEVNLETWKEYKAWEPTTQKERALKCLYINRTNYSGIMTDDVGPIGGRTQEAQEAAENKIYARFDDRLKEGIIKRINFLAQYQDRVSYVWTIDWFKGIQRIREKQQNGILPQDNLFFYFDPPYFKKSQKLYRENFTPYQHKKLRDFVIELEDNWLLSYDQGEEFDFYYSDVKINAHSIVHLIYSVATSTNGTREKGSEYVLSNLDELPKNTELQEQEQLPGFNDLEK